MILPENLYRCNKIAHCQDQNLKKMSAEVKKNPAADQKVSPQLLNYPVFSVKSLKVKVECQGAHCAPRYIP
jgi:hypothetical protein